MIPTPNLDSLADPVKFGVIADLHGGFARDAGKRLDSFLTAMGKSDCNALIQLGDFAFPNPKHQEFADKLNAAHDSVIHVIGNHEFDYELKREDCYRAWKIDSSYYRRDVSGIRVLVLDGNDAGSPTHDGGYHSYIGHEQKAWLEKELASTDKPVLILSHQPLAGNWPIDNAGEVQKLLSEHREKIVVCLNGHSHIDSLVKIGGVSYLHINSASYFWVGGKARTAFYKDPLFTEVTIDPSTATVAVAGRVSEWKSKSPMELEYFERDNVPAQADVAPRIRQRKIAR